MSIYNVETDFDIRHCSRHCKIPYSVPRQEKHCLTFSFTTFKLNKSHVKGGGVYTFYSLKLSKSFVRWFWSVGWHCTNWRKKKLYVVILIAWFSFKACWFSLFAHHGWQKSCICYCYFQFYILMHIMNDDNVFLFIFILN